jgi:hypothetical protein
MTCATIIACAQVADRERAHAAARNVNGGDRVAQKFIGGSVLEGYAVKCPPLNIVAESLDQGVANKNLASLIENQRREA